MKKILGFIGFSVAFLIAGSASADERVVHVSASATAFASTCSRSTFTWSCNSFSVGSRAQEEAIPLVIEKLEDRCERKGGTLDPAVSKANPRFSCYPTVDGMSCTATLRAKCFIPVRDAYVSDNRRAPDRRPGDMAASYDSGDSRSRSAGSAELN